jgi:diamine N-acetyltransferase
MDVLIRKAKKKDVDEVYNVLLEMIKSEDASSKRVSQFLMDSRKKRSDFQDSAKQELIREFRERNSTYLVAELNDKIIGYIRGNIIQNKDPFFQVTKIGYLNALAVLKNHSGKGIASKLNKSLEKWFKENECSQIHLEVFENNPATKIYEKWGYKTFNRKMGKKI